MGQSFITEEMVIEEVKQAIADALEIEKGTIQADSSLIRDLGAESLDFLDINYRLEQAFGIKMARHSVLEHVEETFGEESAIDSDGRLTEKAVELLNIRFGGAEAGLTPGMEMDEVPAVVTVKSMAIGVLDILSSLPEKCPECGNSAWELEDGAHIKCGSCGEPGAFVNGDDLTKEWLEQVQEERKIF